MSDLNKNNDLRAPRIYLDKLTINNFRGFGNVTVKFDDRLNIIIGENGSGKTALIECAAKSLAAFIMSSVLNRPIYLNNFFTRDDLKYDSLSLSIKSGFFINDKMDEFNLVFQKKDYKRWENPFDIGLHPIIIYNRINNFPVFCYYPTIETRHKYTKDDLVSSTISEHDVYSIYYNYLEGIYNDTEDFFSWIKWQENIEKQVGKNDVLKSVKSALYSLLSDDENTFDNLRIDWLKSQKGEMLIDKNQIPLNINQLSSGEHYLLALVGDLARRLAIANPNRDNPLTGYGIVIIDEIDRHMHPRLQRSIVHQLHKTFPNCQFIVTTHSPLVLSKIKPDNIIMLSNFEQRDSIPYTFGRDTNSILLELMDVSEWPKESRKIIDEIYDLMDDGKLAEADKRIETLKKDFGEHDSEILKLITHRNFMQMDL